MNTFALRIKARQLYNNSEAPAHINQHNQRAWVRSVLMLGAKWLFAQPINRP